MRLITLTVGAGTFKGAEQNMRMVTEYDFSPIERMTAHLLAHDQAEARKRVARERRPRRRTADSDTPTYCAAATALGDRTAAKWASDHEWDVRYAPYFVANFFDWRIEMAEQYRQSIANDNMLNHHLRKVWDCNTDSAATIWQEFDGLIETLRARIIAGVESRSITRLDIKGMAHVDASTTIDHMRGIGACALLEVATGVVNAGSEAAPIALAVGKAKSRLTDKEIADRHKELRAAGNNNYTQQVAREADISKARVRVIVAKVKASETSTILTGLRC